MTFDWERIRCGKGQYLKTGWGKASEVDGSDLEVFVKGCCFISTLIHVRVTRGGTVDQNQETKLQVVQLE